MSYVYFLFSEKDNKWYIGCTDRDPVIRLDQHNAGRTPSTRNRRPFVLAYIEEYEMHVEAAHREWHLKHPRGFLEKKAITTKFMEERARWPIHKE